MRNSNYKVAYLVSHPIQYQAPLLRYIVNNSNIDLTTYFLSDFSVRDYADPGFESKIEWDVPLLGGYKHVLLPSIGPNAPVTATAPLNTHIFRNLKAGKYDALWLHGYAHPSNLRAIISAKLLGIKVLVRAESQITSASGSARSRKIKEPVIRFLFKQLDALLAIGTLNAEYYQRFGVPAEKIFSVPYTVDNAFFQQRSIDAAPNRERLRESLGLEPNRPVILYASKFQARKRAIDLIEAYSKLSADGVAEPVPYLLFIGDGEERANLISAADKLKWTSIKFLGFKNQTELPGFFDLCDVFVLASEIEPWGLIVNEVMNAGKAVIVSDRVGCAVDLVRDGVNGYIVPPREPEVLAKRLRDVLDVPGHAAEMGKASLRQINSWGFEQDLAGLEKALMHSVGSKTS